jgi:hypothetical protein
MLGGQDARAPGRFDANSLSKIFVIPAFIANWRLFPKDTWGVFSGFLCVLKNQSRPRGLFLGENGLFSRDLLPIRSFGEWMILLIPMLRVGTHFLDAPHRRNLLDVPLPLAQGMWRVSTRVRMRRGERGIQ